MQIRLVMYIDADAYQDKSMEVEADTGGKTTSVDMLIANAERIYGKGTVFVERTPGVSCIIA